MSCCTLTPGAWSVAAVETSDNHLVGWLFVGSLVMFVAGLVVVPWLIVAMPADFFLRHDRPPQRRHPAIHVLAVATRNLIGWPLLVAGVIMLVAPGQGLLTILVAICLVDFPGKRRVELAIVRRPAIRRAIDWIRAKAHKPPLELP